MKKTPKLYKSNTLKNDMIVDIQIKQAKEVTKWIAETKQNYNMLKSLSLKNLTLLGKQAGLDMTYYTTKSKISKGLIIRLTSGMLPIEFNNWK